MANKLIKSNLIGRRDSSGSGGGPLDPEKYATKQELHDSETRLSNQIALLEAHLDTKFEKTNADLNQKMDNMDAKFNHRFDLMDAKFDQRMNQMDAKFDQKMAHMDAEFNKKFDQNDIRFEKVNTHFANIEAEIQMARNSMIRWYLGSSIALVGLVIAAIHYLM
ncbi:hypothetical protein [Lentilactobacillus diolivorans]|uniref:DUF1640 domain-containing protein n=2 Tax=Lentilactobacillus diolivorans TaxID=179838 RepID=A0A0R1SDV9_9LACO|nr:hypothetical protein [Lentilactobacillus diolivorans]KRL67782.1 hypothetical protein FC85_GL002641 [Lentilactobacillus diolivorans DSM 14421]GEP22946.1 hypothetical protein LDI01_05390 [Lentilactobacillus diolivorans]